MDSQLKLRLLDKKFIGKGDVKGFKFEQLESSSKAYLYRVIDGRLEHFEVFTRVKSKICLNFKKRQYAADEFKEVYPSSKIFGAKAKIFNDYNKAKKYFNQLSNYKKGCYE